MKYDEIKGKVDAMYKTSHSCDLEVITEIEKELDFMKAKVHSAMEIMKENESVKQYIDLQKSLACINEAKFYMNGYHN